MLEVVDGAKKRSRYMRGEAAPLCQMLLDGEGSPIWAYCKNEEGLWEFQRSRVLLLD
jgi:hypothetical protein